ncbi:MAG TPA: phage capsid protein [Flavobacteriales bacterium]|nr:phage capsid protein [Flavobacteriales bacterium]HMR28553.1 phage capsid protein [Flavobacteriales bacterium]
MKQRGLNRLRLFTLIALMAVSSILVGGLLSGLYASAHPDMTDPGLVWGVTSALIFGVQLAERFAPSEHRNVHAYAITREWWVDYIMDALFPKNSFMDRCYNESDYVIGGKTVHLPQAGSHPAVVKNRSSFPATAAERTDTEVTYDLDEYSTDPIRIRNAEQAELSYDKTASVMMTSMEQLRTRVADDLAWKWAASAAANIVRTTGADSALNLPNATATGTRKILTLADVRAARKILNKQDVAYEGRVLVLDSNMLDELMSDSALLTRDNAQEVDLRAGTLVRLYGFDVMERSRVVTYTNAGTPVKKDPAAAEAATDNGGAIAYGPTYVARALGDIEVFEDLKNPLHYGDVYSFLVRCGGRQRRGDGKGVVSIVQTAGA